MHTVTLIARTLRRHILSMSLDESILVFFTHILVASSKDYFGITLINCNHSPHGICFITTRLSSKALFSEKMLSTDTSRSAHSVPLRRKSSPVTMMRAATTAVAVAAAAAAAAVTATDDVNVVSLSSAPYSTTREGRKAKSATGGTINLYAKHVRAATHTETHIHTHARHNGTHLRLHLPSGSEYSATGDMRLRAISKRRI